MTVVGKSHTGRVRETNQDRYGIYNIGRYALAVVCDGMGGENAGDIASEDALTALEKYVEDHVPRPIHFDSLCQTVARGIDAANAQVYARSQSAPEYEGMGTTCTCVLTDGKRVCIYNVGDSRAYLISPEIGRQITVDHTYVQMLVEQGKLAPEARGTHPRRNYLMRALGVSRQVEKDSFFFDMEKDHNILLCSDGLSSYCSDDEIYHTVRSLEPTKACESLVELANAHGGRDNITVVILSHGPSMNGSEMING